MIESSRMVVDINSDANMLRTTGQQKRELLNLLIWRMNRQKWYWEVVIGYGEQA